MCCCHSEGFFYSIWSYAANDLTKISLWRSLLFFLHDRDIETHRDFKWKRSKKNIEMWVGNWNTGYILCRRSFRLRNCSCCSPAKKKDASHYFKQHCMYIMKKQKQKRKHQQDSRGLRSLLWSIYRRCLTGCRSARGLAMVHAVST
jgi:hypothetical protein